MRDLDLRRVVREGIRERRDVRADFARRGDRADDVAAVRAQHAALIGHLDARDPLAHAVHRPGGDSSPPRILARTPHAADVVVARVHCGEELGDLLGRILQIGVERDHALAARAIETGDDRHVLTVVRIEHDHPCHVGTLEVLVL